MEPRDEASPAALYTDILNVPVHDPRGWLAAVVCLFSESRAYRGKAQVKAARLQAALADQNASIADAFASCGMSHAGNASRFFTDQVGMTPTQYRAALTHPEGT